MKSLNNNYNFLNKIPSKNSKIDLVWLLPRLMNIKVKEQMQELAPIPNKFLQEELEIKFKKIQDLGLILKDEQI